MGSTSREKLISYLYQLIELELEKPENKVDMDLIAECSAYLADLQEGQDELSDEEIQLQLQKIKAQVLVDNSVVLSKNKPIKKKFSHRLLKVFLPIAAAFLVLFLTLSVLASVNGTTIGEFISDNLQKISKLSKGETVEVGNITVYKSTKVSTYQTIEDFLSQENLDILFPQPLPSGISIEFIQIDHLNETHTIIAFLFEGKDIQMTVRNTYQMNYNAAEYSDKMTVGDITYYVYPSDNFFLISAQYNGYEYTLESSNFDLLKQFITNMKEFKK